MADWQDAIEQVKRPQIAIPAGAILITGVTAGVLGFVLGKWIYVIVALLGILVTLLAFLIFALYSREREERLKRGTVDEGGASVMRRREEARATIGLEEGFRRAVAVIEARELGGLPWYLVLGARGAGKSALLRASGLDLPAAVEKLVGTGPTADCDWWLTNQAVFIDTAGRYLANEGPDEREWRQLLSLVRKYRTRPALLGVLVVLSAADLLSKPAGQLEAEASELRRHLNEIVDLLGVDPPVYLLVTQADRIQGLADAAASLGGARLQEAFGWTNRERYPHDAGRTVGDAFASLRERIELALPDLLVREPDPNRRRRLFLLPQEIAGLSRALSTLVGRAFAPALYDEAPFLRGVYLTSALREGALVSPVLDRLGHPWAKEAVDPSISPGSWFARDFFRRILLDSEEQGLAVPTESVGPRTRAVVLGVAYALAAVLVVLWSISLYYNWSAIRVIRQAAWDAHGRGLSIDVLDRLRQALETYDEAGNTGLYGVGLGSALRRAAERGKKTFVAGFGSEFEEPAKASLLDGVGRSDGDAFDALEDLAADLGYLATRGSDVSSAPDLVRYSDARRNDQEKTAFTASYASFVRWAQDVEIASRVQHEQERFDQEAPRLLEISRLEAWCNTHPEAAPPVRYQGVGLPHPGPGAPDAVSGCYTRPFYEKRIAALVENVERSGRASRESVERFREDYTRRYAESWATFLVATPRPPLADAGVTHSPYLNLLAKIDDNTNVDGLWLKRVPGWVRKLHAVRSEVAPSDKEKAPWTRYEASLESVNSVVERVHGRSHLAFAVAKDVSDGQDTEFKKAIELVRKELVPVEAEDEDRTQTGALQSILLMPILNGFTAVLESAAQEVDQMWKDQIVAPFPPPLTPDAHERLYGPGGALERFRREVLAPFASGSQARPLLEDREMPLSPRLLTFVATGGRSAGGGGGGGAMPSGPQTVRLVGAPSEVSGSSGVFVTGQELTLVCASRPEQRFEYSDGVGEKVFTWTPDCDLVQLVVHVRSADGHEEELPREWNGPFAFSAFLRDGQPAGDGSYQWTVSDRTGSNVRVVVRYRRRGGEDIIRFEKAASQAPPSSAVN
jgi:ImcF (intracellular multiplication and macrophage-killing)-related protein